MSIPTSRIDEEELFRPYRPLKSIPVDVVQVVHFVTVPVPVADYSSIPDRSKMINIKGFHDENSKFREKFSSGDLRPDNGLALNEFPESNDLIDFDFHLIEEDKKVDYSLRWERHIAFETYTFFRYGSIKHSDSAWENLFKILKDKGGIPGKVNKLCLTFVKTKVEDKMVTELLNNGTAAGSYIFGERAKVQISSNFDYIIINGISSFSSPMSDSDAALLIQHLLYIKTYMIIAELELSVNDRKNIISELYEDDAKIKKHIYTLKEIINDSDIIRGRFGRANNLLADVAKTWNEIESDIAKINEKLMVSQTHYSIAIDYIDQLNEKSISGLTTVGQFLHRSIDPAVVSNTTILRHLDSLAHHTGRLNELLRTGSEINLLRYESWISLVLFFLTCVSALYYGSQLFAHFLIGAVDLIIRAVDLIDKNHEFSKFLFDLLKNHEFSQFIGVIVAFIALLVFLYIDSFRRFCLKEQRRILNNMRKNFTDIEKAEEYDRSDKEEK